MHSAWQVQHGAGLDRASWACSVEGALVWVSSAPVVPFTAISWYGWWIPHVSSMAVGIIQDRVAGRCVTATDTLCSLLAGNTLSPIRFCYVGMEDRAPGWYCNSVRMCYEGAFATPEVLDHDSLYFQHSCNAAGEEEFVCRLGRTGANLSWRWLHGNFSAGSYYFAVVVHVTNAVPIHVLQAGMGFSLLPVEIQGGESGPGCRVAGTETLFPETAVAANVS